MSTIACRSEQWGSVYPKATNASLIGLSLFVPAVAGWFLLKGLSEEILGFLIAMGAGGMFYLTIADLVPRAESHQSQQSSAIANALGCLLMMALAELI